jgi:plasmid stabilization system protein ParE
MAGESRNLTVSLSPAAQLALDEIWEWNARHYSVEHAAQDWQNKLREEMP